MRSFLTLLLLYPVLSAQADDPIREVLDLIESNSLGPSIPGSEHSCNTQAVFESACERFKKIAKLDWRSADASGLECLSEEFSRCYPNLRPTIEKKTLDQLFQNWTEDPRFRYASGGGGECAIRAESLAHELAELSISAKIVRIEHSPSLIVMDRDMTGKLTGRFHDYRGYHTLVQVNVREGERDQPYFLDPQFMGRPLTPSEYFRRTTGQDCLKNEGPIGSYLRCYYRLQPQNTPSGSVNIHRLMKKSGAALGCGWNRDPDEILAGSTTARPALNSGLELMNPGFQEPPLGSIGEAPVTENTPYLLIVRAYSGYGERLREIQKSTELEIERLEAGWLSMGMKPEDREPRLAELRTRQKQLKKDLQELPRLITEIQRRYQASIDR
jgi:hypothetical protein